MTGLPDCNHRLNVIDILCPSSIRRSLARNRARPGKTAEFQDLETPSWFHGLQRFHTAVRQVVSTSSAGEMPGWPCDGGAPECLKRRRAFVASRLKTNADHDGGTGNDRNRPKTDVAIDRKTRVA